MSLDGTGSTDRAFLADLAASAGSVEVVARWLSEQGYPVLLRPTFVRPERAQWAEYADDGDLEIMQRIEVKQRKSLTFTSKEDFPYPTVIVDDAADYERKRPRPYMYVITNTTLDRALVVYCRMEKQWKKEKHYDRNLGRDCLFLECPLELAMLIELPRNA